MSIKQFVQPLDESYMPLACVWSDPYTNVESLKLIFMSHILTQKKTKKQKKNKTKKTMIYSGYYVGWMRGTLICNDSLSPVIPSSKFVVDLNKVNWIPLD